MSKRQPRLIGFVIATLLVTIVASESVVGESPVFEKDVLPLFTRYCFNCHGKSSPQLGLDLRTARLAIRGSQNGPVIVAGSLEKSLLWKKISTREMPLNLFKLKMTDGEIETIREWIEGGAQSAEPIGIPADVQEQFSRFNTEIRPIFAERCDSCHSGDEPEGGLDLRSLQSLVRGSESGPVIVEGFSEKSVLVRKVSSGAMPPPDSEEQLTAAEIRTITRWIDKGRFVDFIDTSSDRQRESIPMVAEATAKEREFWAFQEPVASPPPEVTAVERVRTPIDRFVLTKLEAVGLTFSPDASKLMLLRRAYFDLTGLPPTPEEAREFLEDERPDAFERLIDRLLASPRYGERWGRHWLDVVGYLDSAGKDFNPNAVTLFDGFWRYRDYVIESTNRDTSWNQFLVEQIAGDELVDWRNAKKYTPEIRQLLTATGYLRNVLDATDEDISNLPFDRYEALFKLMERVSTSTMGMTLACARCHNHKFDPIPQSDYYRFLSLFTAAYNPSDWLPPKERHLFSVSKLEKDEIDHHKTSSGKLKLQLAAISQRYRKTLLAVKLQLVPESTRDATRLAIETVEKKRTEAQRELAAKYEDILRVTNAEITMALSDSDRKTREDLRSQLLSNEQFLAAHPFEKIQALWDVGKPPTIRLLHRGDVEYAGPKVDPGFLSVLSTAGESTAVASSQAVGETTGLRLAFAEWLTRPGHPLTARVIVNRMWQHHFGRGIVDTPGNFGATGSRPTHPALLDWLAVDFIRHDWNAKRLHRMMMMSTAYRQTSKWVPNTESTVATSTDSANRLLWRMNLRRLDAESLRDAIIAVSGQSNYTMGGPPVMLKATTSGLQMVASDGQTQMASRRSVYVLARRSNPLTFLKVFDYPVIDVNCTRRSASATPLQSLTMINSEFVAASAAHLARRIDGLVGTTAPLEVKIETAYWITLSRSPSESEIESASEHLRRLQESYVAANVAANDAANRSFENLVQMLQCSNEFLYID
ncbi:MAG: PSD1 and planctomycete cytochrome C domain-containing protein [Pirellulaceae bacterium]